MIPVEINQRVFDLSALKPADKLLTLETIQKAELNDWVVVSDVENGDVEVHSERVSSYLKERGYEL